MLPTKVVLFFASVLQCCISFVISLAWSVLKVPDFPAVSIMGLYAHALSRVQTSPSVSIVFFISSFSSLVIKLLGGI